MAVRHARRSPQLKLLATKKYGRENPGRILFISTSVVARQA
jgi:hypothetical protein